VSKENQDDGLQCFAEGDSDTKGWFARQWKIWPKRADETKTTNLSFLYGGILAYRKAHQLQPEMSNDLRQNIEWLDRHP